MKQNNNNNRNNYKRKHSTCFCLSAFTFPIVNLHFHRRVHTRRNFYLNKKRAIAVTHRLTNSRHAGWNEFLPFFNSKKIGGLLTWNRATVFSILLLEMKTCGTLVKTQPPNSSSDIDLGKLRQNQIALN